MKRDDMYISGRRLLEMSVGETIVLSGVPASVVRSARVQACRIGRLRHRVYECHARRTSPGLYTIQITRRAGRNH